MPVSSGWQARFPGLCPQHREGQQSPGPPVLPKRQQQSPRTVCLPPTKAQLRRRALRCRAAASVAVDTNHAGAAQHVSSAKKPLRVMIAGAPAAGKGTQCERIVKKFGLVHVSAGDLLRAEVLAGTDAGKRAESFMSQGYLVPNELVVEMVKERLAQPDAQERGWLLDGYPRSDEQAEAIEEAGIRPDVFILIDVPDQELVERVTGRRLDPETGMIYHLKFKPPPDELLARLIQRSDDTEAKLRNRLETHHKNVAAVVGYYRDMLVEVNGQRSMEEVFAEIDGVLSAFTEDDAALQAA